MYSEFENCTGFIINSNIFKICTGLIGVSWLKPTNINNYLNLYWAVQLLVSTVLGQPILKTTFLYRLIDIGLTGQYQR
jgi:hypothetical protein